MSTSPICFLSLSPPSAPPTGLAPTPYFSSSSFLMSFILSLPRVLDPRVRGSRLTALARSLHLGFKASCYYPILFLLCVLIPFYLIFRFPFSFSLIFTPSIPIKYRTVFYPIFSCIKCSLVPFVQSGFHHHIFTVAFIIIIITLVPRSSL